MGSDLEVCYDAANAWQLTALIDALVDVYSDVAACERQRAEDALLPTPVEVMP